jgi:hypothetical protein
LTDGCAGGAISCGMPKKPLLGTPQLSDYFFDLLDQMISMAAGAGFQPDGLALKFPKDIPVAMVLPARLGSA